MADIAQTEALTVFKKYLMPAINDERDPKTFLRSLARDEMTAALEISYEIERALELAATDVDRASQGNLNTFSKSTEKIFIPPMFREYFAANELAAYDRVFGSSGTSGVQSSQVDALISQASKKLAGLRNKIERAYSKQVSDVLFTRKLTLKNGDNLDFKAKAASTLTPPVRWSASATAVPLDDLETQANFINSFGKSDGDGVFNVLMGDSCFTNFMKCDQVTKFGDYRRISRLDISMPDWIVKTGAVAHGEVTGGSYKFRIWTFPATYNSSSSANTKYIPTKECVVFPDDMGLRLMFAGVPTKQGQNYVLSKGDYHVRNYNKDTVSTSYFDIASAGVVVPVLVDRIASIKAIA